MKALRRAFSVDTIPAWKRPWWCCIAYWEVDALTAVCYPPGIHWIVRVYRRFNPTPGHRRLAEWRRGRTNRGK